MGNVIIIRTNANGIGRHVIESTCDEIATSNVMDNLKDLKKPYVKFVQNKGAVASGGNNDRG